MSYFESSIYEMTGTFWLLNSGVSCHFTGDLGDFTSYQKLKHEHYAKMTTNGVVLITGIGMVLLWCLDHNTGDEKVVKLTQVLLHTLFLWAKCFCATIESLVIGKASAS